VAALRGRLTDDHVAAGMIPESRIRDDCAGPQESAFGAHAD
jgi:hypothetical protein